jgi:hypothetical protein
MNRFKNLSVILNSVKYAKGYGYSGGYGYGGIRAWLLRTGKFEKRINF